MSLSDIVSVTIDAQTTNPSRVGFGTPLLVGHHTVFAERVRFYANTGAMITDGFLTSSALYKAAAAVFSQNPSPTRIAVGRLTTASTMTVNCAPVVQNTRLYTVTINGVPFSFTSDASATAQEIVDGLVAAINAGAEPVTASNVANVLRLIADVPGVVFALEINYADMTLSNDTTDGSGIAAQLAAISLENDEWYALVMDSWGEAEIEAAAAYIESVKKVFIAITSDSDVLAAPLTDVGSDLKAAAYDRTALIFARRVHQYANAAWAGKVLPDDPGSSTWKFKTLAGVTADTFTETELSRMRAKNVNWYQAVAGVNITQEGYLSSGEWIDTTIFVDWLSSTMQINVYAVKVANKKVPFTDAGIGLIDNAIRGALSQGESRGGLVDGQSNVIVPLAADVSTADKNARTLTGVTFTAKLAGAVHKTVIQGTVSV